MWGLKRAAALLLPALTNSLVLPPDQAPRPVTDGIPERPALRLPFVYEYREWPPTVPGADAAIANCRQDAKDEASIRFTLQTDGAEPTLDDPESELTSVIVSGSDAAGCAADVDTHIQVNGETLIASNRRVVDRQVIQRSGTSSLLVGPGQTAAASSWTLQCVCMDALSSILGGASSTCQTFGYILNFQSPSSAASDASGFSLSFTQSTKPKLLRLTTLAFATIDASKSIAQDLTNSRHWLAPLLHPISTIIGEVPTSTLSQLLPKFSTTGSQSFRTVTTPSAPTTTQYFAAESSLPVNRPTLLPPSRVLGEKPSPTPRIAHDELDDVHFELDSDNTDSGDTQDDQEDDTPSLLRQFFIGAGHRAQKTFHEVVDHLVQAHDALQQSSSIIPDRLRNETREFYEGSRYNETVLTLAEMPDVSFEHVFAVCVGTFTLVGGAVFACIWYRDPRRRAERAARREEKANRRLYQKAARRQKFKNWFDRLRGRETYQPQSQTFARAQLHMRNPSHSSDLEWHDKEEGPAPDASGVHKELGELREAHGFVEGILRATSGIYRNSRIRASSRGSRRRRYSDAASEKSMLPPYTVEDECEDQIVVVDGLHFTIRRRREATPGSSIIDTSPRESDCGSSDGGKE